MNSTLNLKLIFEQIANNSPKAFQLFFDYSYTRLFRYASYFISDIEDCKEVVSDVYFHLWENRRKLTNIQNVDNYLFICVRNNALHYIREKERYQKIELVEVYPSALSDKMDPEKIMIEEELRCNLELVINSLPQRCRLIFFMVKEEGMKYKDVAKNLDISERTVHAQMCIAVKRIGAVIKEFQIDRSITNTKQHEVRDK